MVEGRQQLVPIIEDEQLLLSPKQQKELIDAARMYLRKNKIPMESEAVLHRAMAVLGDAYRRALIKEGRFVIRQGERLSPLVKQGLELREEIKLKARQHVQLGFSLDLPLSLIKACQIEQAENFYLIENPQYTQGVVDLVELRIPILNKLIKVSLDNLPEGLEVSSDRFPTIQERSKLTRNMLTSFIFRGMLSPLITITDLKEFVAKQHTEDQFIDGKKNSLLNNLSQNQEEANFISGLLHQTEAVFKSHTQVPSADDPKAIDEFYLRFNNILLLLHPALEEQTIIIQSSKITEGSPHLWQDGERIGSYVIPKPEILAQAARQMEAKGDKLTSERLHEGIKAWSRYENETRRQKYRFDREEQRTKELEEMFLNLDNPDFPLPPHAYTLNYQPQIKAREEVSKGQREMEYFFDIAEEVAKREEEAQKYKEYLQTTFGSNLPELVPIPTAFFKKRLERDVITLKGRLTAYKSRLTLIEELLNVDLFRISQFGEALGMLNKENVLEEIDRQFKNREVVNTPLNEALIKRVIYFLTEGPGRKLEGMKHLPQPLRDFAYFWEFSDLTLQRILERPNVDQWQKFLIEATQQRNKILEYTRTYITSGLYRRLLSQLVETENKLANLSLNSLVSDESWTKKEALDYLEEVELKKLPEMDIPSKILSQDVKKLRLTIPAILPSSLPREIKSRQQLLIWLKNKKQSLQDSLRRKGRDIKQMESDLMELKTLLEEIGFRNRMEQQLRHVYQLINFIDHPILPIRDDKTIDRNKFLEALKVRVDVAYANLFRSQLIIQSLEVQQKYQEIVRLGYKDWLTETVANKKEYISQLKNTDVDKELLLERMKTLNLVLEEDNNGA